MEDDGAGIVTITDLTTDKEDSPIISEEENERIQSLNEILET